MACPCQGSLTKKVVFLNDKETDLKILHDLLDEKLMEFKNNRYCHLQPDLQVINELNCALKKLQCAVDATQKLNQEMRESKNNESCDNCEDTRKKIFEQIQMKLDRLKNCSGPCLCGEKIDDLGEIFHDEPKDTKSHLNESALNDGFRLNIFKKIKNRMSIKNDTTRRSKELESNDDLSDISSSSEIIEDIRHRARKSEVNKTRKLFSKIEMDDKFPEKIKEKKHHMNESKSSDDVNKLSAKETKSKKRLFKKYSSSIDVYGRSSKKTKEKKHRLKESKSDDDVDKVPAKKTKEKKHRFKKSKSDDDVDKVPAKKTKEKKHRLKETKSDDDEDKLSAKKTKHKKRLSKEHSSKNNVKEVSIPKIKDERKPPKKLKITDEVAKTEPKRRESLRKSITKTLKDTRRRVKEFSKRIDEDNDSYIRGTSSRFTSPTGFCEEIMKGDPPFWIPMGPKSRSDATASEKTGTKQHLRCV
ncbi:unnamed protein product [Spodoptera exigua]|nr:unnamed protein product [Spodoptera exigua]